MHSRKYFLFIFILVIGARARKIAEVNYRTDKIIERGKAVLKDKKKFFRKKDVDEEGEEQQVEEEGDHIDDDEGKNIGITI